jgi:hypothetical protein
MGELVIELIEADVTGIPWRATGSNDFEHKFKKLGAFCIIAKFKVVVVSY